MRCYIDAAEIVTCLLPDPIVLCTGGLGLAQVRMRLSMSVDMQEQARNGVKTGGSLLRVGSVLKYLYTYNIRACVHARACVS